MANNAELDQALCADVSDLDLQCLLWIFCPNPSINSFNKIKLAAFTFFMHVVDSDSIRDPKYCKCKIIKF